MISRDLIEILQAFSQERDWGQFHTQENLAKSISIEASKLLECFQWSNQAATDKVVHELADVFAYCLLLADKLGVDPIEIVKQKLEITRSKYPVDKSRGRSEKYDQL